MKKITKFIGIVLASFVMFSCNITTEKDETYAVIPENKTGVVISNPFKDGSEFKSRAITYYSKYDVERYVITAYYLGSDSSGEGTVADTLTIKKDDSYSSKTLTFDNEGTYKFKCEAYTANAESTGDNNTLIAEDTVTKTLSFANAEFIIFYLIPKIKSQTADISATITWQGDDATAVAHTIRIVRPSDGLDTTIEILQNGKCSYADDAVMPVIETSGKWKASSIKLSDCNVSSMIGKIADSYSFSIQISIKDEIYQNNSYWNNTILSWTRSYTESNTVSANSLNQCISTGEVKGSDCWILLDGKISETLRSHYWEGIIFNYNNINQLYKTADEIKDAYYTIDEKGNIITLGDYVATVGSDNNNYNFSGNNSEYVCGSRLYLENVNESVYKGTVYDLTEESTSEVRSHYVIFKRIAKPYSFN